MLDISLIGTGGMLPLKNRFLTAMVARLNGSMLLIDCGEGTQVTLKELGWGFKSLDVICFTHFHADHMVGLPGLLLTVGNSGRTEPITIVGPVGVREVVKALCVVAPVLPYELRFMELSFEGKEDFISLAAGNFAISAVGLDHRMDCIGYGLHVQRAGKFDAEKAKRQEIPVQLWGRLQKGESVEAEGRLYTPDMVLGPKRKGIKVSYVTDTRPTTALPQFIAGSDLFICEGLYGDDEEQPQAAKHAHMVFSEAAALAKAGNVKELWLTHYSPAMPDPEQYLENATRIFSNSKAGFDRMTATILFANE